MKTGLAAALLLVILENCDTTGTTGPPPVPPEFITEHEAREIVTGVFDRNGIALEEDYDLIVALSQTDTLRVDLDGYNDSLKVGYEYICRESGGYDCEKQDEILITDDIRSSLDSLLNSDGPYVRVVDPLMTDAAAAEKLDSLFQEFIDSLKSQGVI